MFLALPCGERVNSRTSFCLVGDSRSFHTFDPSSDDGHMLRQVMETRNKENGARRQIVWEMKDLKNLEDEDDDEKGKSEGDD